MAIHANSTPTPERLLLRDTAAPGCLLQTPQARQDELLAILDAGPIDPGAPALLSRQRRKRSLLSIEALIDLLDAIETDPDLEDDDTELNCGPAVESDECEPDDEGDELDHGEIDRVAA